MKMHQGHHGANHPVKDMSTGKVEITSMNHGFAVDRATLPANATETHVSLFDGSNCGIALKDKAGVLREYTGSLTGPARQPLPVRAVHADDAGRRAK